MFILSMIVYGVAIDFFNVSGPLFVDQNTAPEIRSSAQGLFMLMTNGVGGTIGVIAAQYIINAYTYGVTIGEEFYTVGDWPTCWYIFSAYALVVGVVFAMVFHPKNQK